MINITCNWISLINCKKKSLKTVSLYSYNLVLPAKYNWYYSVLATGGAPLTARQSPTGSACLHPIYIENSTYSYEIHLSTYTLVGWLCSSNFRRSISMGSGDNQPNSIKNEWKDGRGEIELNSICISTQFGSTSIGGSTNREVTYGSNSTTIHSKLLNVYSPI